MAEQKTNSYVNIWNELKKFLSLQLDYAKLTATEKLTIILSAMAVIAVVTVIGGLALLYLSLSLVYLIGAWIDSVAGAYLIVGGIFILLLIIVYSLRTHLILNPVSRFLSKLFLDPNK